MQLLVDDGWSSLQRAVHLLSQPLQEDCADARRGNVPKSASARAQEARAFSIILILSDSYSITL